MTLPLPNSLNGLTPTRVGRVPETGQRSFLFFRKRDGRTARVRTCAPIDVQNLKSCDTHWTFEVLAGNIGEQKLVASEATCVLVLREWLKE